MSRLFKNLTLNEGFNDLGDLVVNITAIESPIIKNPIADDTPVPSRNCLFYLHETGDFDQPLPGLQMDFTITDLDGVTEYTYTEFTSGDGYAQIQAPVLPSIPLPGDHPPIVLEMEGKLESRENEYYLEVVDGATQLFTLVLSSVTVHDSKLVVGTKDGSFYPVVPTVTIPATTTALYITDKGEVHAYVGSSSSWQELDQLEFNYFEHPEELTAVSEGFYQKNVASGNPTTGVLGSTGFEDFSLRVTNPQPYYTDIAYTVYNEAGTSLSSGTLADIMPGDTDYVPVAVTYVAPAQTDTSPNLVDVETLTGDPFSADFMNFLISKSLTTLDALAGVGPIEYLRDVPAMDEGDRALQSYVDLYAVTQDLDDAHRVIISGFTSVYRAASTPRGVFVSAVAGGTPGVSIYRAAEIHDGCLQRLKLYSNLTGGILAQLQLEDIPVQEEAETVNVRSSFGDYIQENFLSKCTCDDCTSGISPFAYLTDLIKYAAEHVFKSPSYSPTNYSNFISLLENTFLQPYGTMPVTCDTLHHEFCRVRLVTEVLEQLVENTSGSIPAELLAQLAIDRKTYLQLTYNTLLTQAGTSFNEVRDVFISPEDEKLEKAEDLANKLGIPLYVPGTTTGELTTDVLWLSLDNAVPEHNLTAENLETIFGFRDTQNIASGNIPVSTMETWRGIYLRDAWRNNDYPLSAYTREGMDTADDATYVGKPWKPIVDPDIMGGSDMVYMVNPPVMALWQHRKADVDAFLAYFVSDAAIAARTSADLKNRMVKVVGYDVEGHVIDENKVYLADSPSTWVSFNLLSKSRTGTEISYLLRAGAGEPPMFQPDATMLVLRYHRRMNVISGAAPATSVSLILNAPVDFGNFNEYARFESYDGTTLIGAYETTAAGAQQLTIDDVSGAQVDLLLGSAPSTAFLEGTMYFVYTVEVRIFTDQIPDPSRMADAAFTVTWEYDHLAPVPPATTDPFEYETWSVPAGWVIPTPPAGYYYGKLKELSETLAAGLGTETDIAIVGDDLRMDMATFRRMMVLMGKCENYLAATFSSERPTTDELYELASILRSSAKAALAIEWVKEETRYVPVGETDPLALLLTYQNFSLAITEPVVGPWDPSLQTIPATVGGINQTHRAILDPERLAESDLLEGILQKPYFDLYANRKQQLAEKQTEYESWLTPYDADGVANILLEINTGSTSGSFTHLTPYTTLEEILADLQSSDPYKVSQATTVVYRAFTMSSEEFIASMEFKSRYENPDATLHPSVLEQSRMVGVFVSAFKRMQWFPLSLDLIPPAQTPSSGWLKEEIDGSFTDGIPVLYYNVLKLRMAPGRGIETERDEWQETLVKWNSNLAIEVDVVPPENIKEFVPSNIVYQKWEEQNYFLYDPTDGMYPGIYGSFNENVPEADQWNNYRILLCAIFFNTNPEDPTTWQYIGYFTDIQAREEAGEDIRPRLAYSRVSITEYRALRRIYDVLEATWDSPGGIPLLPSEYVEACDIIIHVIKQKSLYGRIKYGLFGNNILLTGDDFRIYKPETVNFPVDDLPAENVLRFTPGDRKVWEDLLESRIERDRIVREAWLNVIAETEDRTMRVMRDALIRALGRECEPFDATAERLAKTLFIETKDNCCAKHTRVSQAIETLQGFLFSLKSGIYDNYLQGFSLAAPNFDEEWEWIGSYATWRSAVFTYLYPENLLYPTLKRRQSPAFINLATKLRDASRLTPEEACELGRGYQTYFSDIQDLEVKLTVTAEASTYRENVDACCADTVRIEDTDFYFANSISSGRRYWSNKPYHDNSANAHGFWEELPIPVGCTMVGCFPLPIDRKPGNLNYVPDNSLWLFYSYLDDNEFKMAYVKKNISQVGAAWSDPVELEAFPAEIEGKRLGQVFAVTACQNSIGWDWPSFILSYKNGDHPTEPLLSFGGYYHVHFRYFDYLNEWEVPLSFYDVNGTSGSSYVTVDFTKRKVLAAVRHSAGSSLYALSFILGEKVFTNRFGETGETNTLPGFGELIGMFKSRVSLGTFYVVYRNGFNQVVLMTFGYVNGQLSVGGPTPITFPYNAVCPSFNVYTHGTLALRENDNVWVGARINFPGLVPVVSDVFALVTTRSSLVSVQSGDCIVDFGERAEQIKLHMEGNMNAPQGTASTGVLRTTAAVEYLYEAYYFVPMLLALDQQQRGQYESALSWYRSVYDYTVSSNISPRKIFFGLVLEESIQNVYNRPADWLLDPLNPHLIAKTRANAYTKYTVMSIVQCLLGYADQEFTMDTIETVPRARKLYTTALDLLGITELAIAPKMCRESAGCLPIFDIPNDMRWKPLRSELQSRLSTLYNYEAVEDAKEGIIEIFNDGELDTATQFAQSFELINNVPFPDTWDVLSKEITDSLKRLDNLFQYFSAFPSVRDALPEYTAFARETFSAAIVNISGADAEALDDEDTRLAWLATDTPITEPYGFNFVLEDHKQVFLDERAYNPLVPDNRSVRANLLYSNASTMLPTFNGRPFPQQRDYLPLIDIKYCTPKNPIYDALALKANLELYKIENCRNIAGMVRELDVYAAPTDSTTGIPVIGAGGTLNLPGLAKFTPSQYRFRVLIDRAKQMAFQAQQLETQFLSALEKRDAEYYNQMKARQDLETSKATVKFQDLRISQANNEREMADLQLDRAEFSYQNFDNWIDTGYNGYEIASLALLQASAVFYSLATAASATAVTEIIFGSGLTNSFSYAAQTLGAQASVFSQIASYERRRQEWTYQRDLAGYDISIANQQIKIAEDNIRIVSQEREIAQLTTDHAQDVLEFLKNKFTNAELYNWMSGVLERSYSYMLNLATSVAKTAEGQLYFERQEIAGPFILDDYWETPGDNYNVSGTNTDRRGLTGSARLFTDITRMDQYAFDTDKRKLQLTKTISLSQNFPVEFATFRTTGVLNFELTDKMFDYDFPGNYLRLIRGIKTTVIGLVPVYGGIKATLTADSTSYTVIGGTTFQRIPIKRMIVDSVGLTSPNASNGLFEMQPVQSEMLNPFEGMGIESRWEFKMPKFSNRLDFDQIADVLVTVEYTALDSFQYRYQVLQELDTTVSFDRAFSFKNNFPDQWFDLSNAQAGTETFGITFSTKKTDFPPGLTDLRFGDNLVLYFVREDGFTDEINVADFNIADGGVSGGGSTVNGIFTPNNLNSLEAGTPIRTWLLTFENNFTNRELFSEEKVTDILFVITCRGDLPSYPL